MKKKSEHTKIIQLLLFLAVLLVLVLSIRLRSANKTLLEVASRAHSLVKIDSIQIDQLSKQVRYSFYQIDLTDCLLDINCNTIVLLIGSNNCWSCIHELLVYLEELGRNLGDERVLVLCNSFDESQYVALKKNIEVFVKRSYFCNDVEIPGEICDHPILFVIDPDFKISNLYIPDFCPEIKVQYFRYVEQLLSTN